VINLEAVHIRRRVNAREAAGARPKTIATQHGLLFMVLGLASRAGLQVGNPCEGTRLPDRYAPAPPATDATHRGLHRAARPRPRPVEQQLSHDEGRAAERHVPPLDEIDGGRSSGSTSVRRARTTEAARRNALPSCTHEYDHHRPHSAIGKVPRITRLTNASGQYGC
jgi:hypothetical protein